VPKNKGSAGTCARWSKNEKKAREKKAGARKIKKKKVRKKTKSRKMSETFTKTQRQ